MVLQRLFENKLFVNAEKCLFHSASVEFLGFVIKQWQVRAEPSKVQKVTYWLAPESCKQLQCFLGFANFYCRYIQDYSHMAAPLTQLTSTKFPFLWTPEADEAFTLTDSGPRSSRSWDPVRGGGLSHWSWSSAFSVIPD